MFNKAHLFQSILLSCNHSFFHPTQFPLICLFSVMRIVWIFIWYTVLATAFLSDLSTGSSNGNPTVSVTTARKLIIKEVSDVGLEDYGPVDPTPSSKKLRPGPIQHSTPLIPYIPRPSPPPPRPSQ